MPIPILPPTAEPVEQRIVESCLGGLSPEIAPLELHESASRAVATEHLQIAALIGEADAADLTKDVKGLLAPKIAGIDDVDEVGLLGGDEHALAAADGGELEVTHAGHL
jgi:hypothetical protein